MQTLLWLQWPLIFVTLVAFWVPVPARDEWLWLLLLFIPVCLVWLGGGITRTPLLLVGGAFLLVGVWNVQQAPFTRGLPLLARPLLGLLVAQALIETARRTGTIRPALRGLTLGAVFLGALALVTTQWNEKALLFQPLLDRLPQWHSLPLFEGGFNANEIAGAIAWMLPPMVGLALYGWREGQPQRWALLAAGLLLVALTFGQSRMAIGGVLVALAVVIHLLLPPGRQRRLAWMGFALLLVAQLTIIVNPFSREYLEARDEVSLMARLHMWRVGAEMVADYPLTGVGLSMFRANAVRQLYPVPGYENSILPHAHNEIVQMGADMGLPGLLLWAGLAGSAFYMIRACWHSGDRHAQAVAVSLGAGLLAHALYGMADAVTFWNRFAFVFWVLLWLLAAQYALVRGTGSE